MCTGLFLTGIVSLIVFKAAGGYNITLSSSGYVGVTSFGNFLLNTGFMWIVALSPLAVIFYFSSAAKKMNVAKCQTAFWIFSSFDCLFISSVFENSHIVPQCSQSTISISEFTVRHFLQS